MKRPDDDLMRDALSHYGARHQENKCVEECCELASAILHYREGRISRQELISEMVDVEITLGQMKVLHDVNSDGAWDAEMQYKQERLSRRMNGGTR